MTYFLSNNNPLILILAASVTMCTQSWNLKTPTINWLSESTLAIYLITDSSGLRSFINTWLLGNVIEAPLRGYLLMILVCLLCISVDKIRKLMLKPVNELFNRLVSKTCYER